MGDVIKDYTAFQGQLSDYEREQIEAWGAEMEKSSQAKLKNPLLRSENDVEFGYPLLYVNFDPLLVRLLREVKYFLLLGFEAPQAHGQLGSRGQRLQLDAGRDATGRATSPVKTV